MFSEILTLNLNLVKIQSGHRYALPSTNLLISSYFRLDDISSISANMVRSVNRPTISSRVSKEGYVWASADIPRIDSQAHAQSEIGFRDSSCMTLPKSFILTHISLKTFTLASDVSVSKIATRKA